VQRIDADHDHLARAIELAERGVGRVSPNPVVGAVITRGGDVLGEGWHEVYGGPHAEVNAIAACDGADLAGATLYVSLEPCCHQGRQPPCTDAILAAGIGRVVVAGDDPSSRAAGRGLGILRDEGVLVDVAGGELAQRARQQNQAFRKHARTGRPLVVFKSAMSLDGKVATQTGDSKWISTESSRALAHRWRASLDAVAVGIGTALSDDPQLTARIEGVHEQPRRVVFDSTARLPLTSRLVAEAPDVPLVVVVSRAAPRGATDALETAGAQIVVATGEHEPARVRSALDQLGALDPPVTGMLLEGGPHLAGSFLDAGQIDELRLFISPLLLGGRTARDPLEGAGVERVADAIRALDLECRPSGGDVLLSARLREW
jgi:diaminohydroxyphosphoribosylaminopyrimidine deaminase/5-amino-6-(5-phosphoribosylamino)uracil reductase